MSGLSDSTVLSKCVRESVEEERRNLHTAASAQTPKTQHSRRSHSFHNMIEALGDGLKPAQRVLLSVQESKLE